MIVLYSDSEIINTLFFFVDTEVTYGIRVIYSNIFSEKKSKYLSIYIIIEFKIERKLNF